jgi:hypothetical protein
MYLVNTLTIGEADRTDISILPPGRTPAKNQLCGLNTHHIALKQVGRSEEYGM